MITVDFPAGIPDGDLRFAVIAARMDGKWIYCRHRERDTWEIPGGHREPGEDILDTARRELREETGAVDFDLEQVGIYRVTRPEGESSCGLLCTARVRRLEPLAEEEGIVELQLGEEPPGVWTYPEIQPVLQEKVIAHLQGQRD